MSGVAWHLIGHWAAGIQEGRIRIRWDSGRMLVIPVKQIDVVRHALAELTALGEEFGEYGE